MEVVPFCPISVMYLTLQLTWSLQPKRRILRQRSERDVNSKMDFYRYPCSICLDSHRVYRGVFQTVQTKINIRPDGPQIGPYHSNGGIARPCILQRGYLATSRRPSTRRSDLN